MRLIEIANLMGSLHDGGSQDKSNDWVYKLSLPSPKVMKVKTLSFINKD